VNSVSAEHIRPASGRPAGGAVSGMRPSGVRWRIRSPARPSTCSGRGWLPKLRTLAHVPVHSVQDPHCDRLGVGLRTPSSTLWGWCGQRGGFARWRCRYVCLPWRQAIILLDAACARASGLRATARNAGLKHRRGCVPQPRRMGEAY